MEHLLFLLFFAALPVSAQVTGLLLLLYAILFLPMTFGPEDPFRRLTALWRAAIPATLGIAAATVTHFKGQLQLTEQILNGLSTALALFFLAGAFVLMVRSLLRRLRQPKQML